MEQFDQFTNHYHDYRADMKVDVSNDSLMVVKYEVSISINSLALWKQIVM